jgi:hypothetical protein
LAVPKKLIIQQEALPKHTFYVRIQINPHLAYPSYLPYYESVYTVALSEIRKRLNWDDLMDGAQGDFEKINRLRHHILSLWYHALLYPEYP